MKIIDENLKIPTPLPPPPQKQHQAKSCIKPYNHLDSLLRFSPLSPHFPLTCERNCNNCSFESKALELIDGFPPPPSKKFEWKSREKLSIYPFRKQQQAFIMHTRMVFDCLSMRPEEYLSRIIPYIMSAQSTVPLFRSLRYMVLWLNTLRLH